jgi:hypothetical protein
MPPALIEFLKKNAKFLYGGGVVGAAFLAGDVKRISDADNKFKALLKTFKDFVLVRVAMAGVFTAVSQGLKTLVRDTGSLEAALKRLQQQQQAARQLSGLVGGIGAARQRVSQLSQVSARGPFKFEELAQANQSLEVFTRGVYSSVEATQEIGKVAISTGTNITDVARAVGVFYDQLRGGQPVEGATDQLRQMGIISQTTADQLNAMVAGGESVAKTFDTLQDALKLASTGIQGYGDDLSTVTAEHEKAAEALKAGFGAPFTDTEIQNTKNMTAAMQAITPTIGQIGHQLAALYNGFSTATSGMVKFIASSSILQGAAKGLVTVFQILTVGLVAFGAYAAFGATNAIIKLGQSFLQLTTFGTAATVAVRALQGVLIVSIWGTIAVAVGTLIGALVNLHRQSQETAKAMQEMAKSQDESIAALAAQAAAVKTLTDKNEALAASIKKLVDLNGEQADSEEKLKQIRQERATIKEQLQDPEVKSKASLAARDKQLAEEEKQEKKRVNIRKNGQDQLKQIIDEATAKSPAHEQMIADEVERRYAIEQENKGIEERSVIAKKGVEAEAAVEDERSKIRADRIQKERELKAAEDKAEAAPRKPKTEADKQAQKKDFEDRSRAIGELKRQETEVAFRPGIAPAESHVVLQAQVQQQLAAQKADALQAELDKKGKTTTPEIRRGLKQQIEQSRIEAGGVQYSAPALAELQKKAGVAQKGEAEAARLGVEAPAVHLRKIMEETDTAAIEAKASGDIRKAMRLEDLGQFAKAFQSFRSSGFGKEDAARLARERTGAEIKEQYAQAGNVVGYLQSIGGGGGLPQQGVDLQRRLVELAASSNEYLKVLSQAEEPQDTQDQSKPQGVFF